MIAKNRCLWIYANKGNLGHLHFDWIHGTKRSRTRSICGSMDPLELEVFSNQRLSVLFEMVLRTDEFSTEIRPDPFPSFPLMEFHLPWVDLGEWVGENELHSLSLFEYLPVNTHNIYMYACMYLYVYVYVYAYVYVNVNVYVYVCNVM